jgi:hypothetical protein
MQSFMYVVQVVFGLKPGRVVGNCMSSCWQTNVHNNGPNHRKALLISLLETPALLL